MHRADASSSGHLVSSGAFNALTTDECVVSSDVLLMIMDLLESRGHNKTLLHL